MIISRIDFNNDYNMHMYEKNKLTIISIFKEVSELCYHKSDLSDWNLLVSIFSYYRLKWFQIIIVGFHVT